MVYKIKIKDSKYQSFESLCKYGLKTIKHYKGRTYPTLPKVLDAMMTEWIRNVNCSIDEKVYYKKTDTVGTRAYFAEQAEEGKPVLKVLIQSKNRKKAKKPGTFQVLTSEEVLCTILNDVLKALRDDGKSLRAARYYRALSKRFDVGRDRISYVLKWMYENLEVDCPVSNSYSVNDDYVLEKDPDDDDGDDRYEDKTDDNNDENEKHQTRDDEYSIDNNDQDARNPTSPPYSPEKLPTSKRTSDLSLLQPQRANQTLKNLTIWNNTTGAFKTMSPLDRKLHRRRE